MPNFAYRGRNAGGQVVNGSQDGNSAAEVADVLMGRGITPLAITPAAGGGDNKPGVSLGSLASIQIIKQKVEPLDVMMFSRQIYTLLKAGVPIMRALAGLQETTSNLAVREMLRDLRDSLDSGRELSLSLARQPRIFSPFYISMVRVGEMTGQLQEVFIRLYEHMAFERFMKEQVSSALRYPTFVIIAMAVAIVIVNIFVIPAFAKVFQDRKSVV